jgi:thiamine-phosphate pyrophosphorylase
MRPDPLPAPETVVDTTVSGAGTEDVGPLVVVTDRRQAAEAGHALVEVVAAAVEAGARCVLLREKDLPAVERRRLALDLVAVLGPAGGRLIVAGDARLAREVGAAGVHLAAADPWPPTGAEARGEWIVGRSCHGTDELRSARREGATYATLSPVFASPSKPGYGPALGLDGLAAACAAVPDLPVLALAGVGPGRAADCLAAGARGVAVMGDIMRAPSTADAVRDLLAELRRRVEP